MTNLKNWAGNFEYSTNQLHQPETLEQLQAAVREVEHLRVLGTRHSFNNIADSTENLLSLERLPSSINIHPEGRKVTIRGIVRYGELAQQLYPAKLALHNLGSLPHISIIGACSTATHGSGDQNGNLATAVSAMEILTASGDIVSLSREANPDVFPGAVVSLGALGVVTSFTLNLLPTFELSQQIYENLPLAALDSHFDAIMGAAYSVSLFTDWQGDAISQVWLKQKAEIPLPAEVFGAKPANGPRHPVEGVAPDACTQQLGVPGPWHERLPHFRFEAIPSVGNEMQTEYFVRREAAVDALRALRPLGDEIAPFLFTSEIRSIAADDLWLSPSYQQDSIAIHFTWKPDWASVRQLLPKIEAALMPFNPRPHWGKLFTLPPQHIQAQYEKLPDFRELLREFDPHGKFRNAFVEELVF
jgi:alditol oxidase